MADRTPGPGATDRPDVESGVDQLHADETNVGAKPRAGAVGPFPFLPAAQRLCPATTNRRARDRCCGRVRHAAAGCRASALVQRDAGGGRHAEEYSATAL